MFTGDTDSEDELADDLQMVVTQSRQALVDVSARLENLETLMRLLCHVKKSLNSISLYS
jgi:hypothetical protein